MYKRQAKNNIKSLDKRNDLINITKKHPIQQIISTIPQLAISFAVLFCLITFYNVSFEQINGITFIVSFISGVAICIIFVLLQLGGAQYKNWQQDPKTRQYIQTASIFTMISIIGFNISMWPVFGVFTPIVIISTFTCVLSILIITTSFF